MNCTTLTRLRQQAYASFTRAGDGMMNLCDALLCETHARTLAEVSLSPCCERKWSSVYEALQDGRIDVPGLRRATVQALLQGRWPHDTLWISFDSSSLARPEASTSADRGMIDVPNLPHATKPVSVGWQFSTMMLLADLPSRWVGILAQHRRQMFQPSPSVLSRYA